MTDHQLARRRTLIRQRAWQLARTSWYGESQGRAWYPADASLATDVRERPVEPSVDWRWFFEHHGRLGMV